MSQIVAVWYTPFVLSQSAALLTEIQTNRSDGAAILALRALEALALFVQEHNIHDGEEGATQIAQWVKQVAALRPSMGAIGTHVLLVYLHAGGLVRHGRRWRDAVMASVSLFRDEASRANCRIAEHAVSVIGTGRRIITCSHSSTLMNAFAKLMPRSVIIGAGEPFNDGVSTARKLAEQRMNAAVVPDGALAAQTARADVVLIGADQILNDGAVVNRSASLALALAADFFNRPVYVLCQRIKISGAAASSIEWEVLPAPPEYHGLRCELPVFDIIPRQFISKVITENGELSTDELLEISKEMTDLWQQI